MKMDGQIENGIVRKPIRRKIIILLLLIALTAQVVTGIVNGVSLTAINSKTNQGLGELQEGAVDDSISTVRALTKDQLKSLAENKAGIVDNKLELIKNQTMAVAYAASDVYANPENYIQNRSIDQLPLDTYDFSCNYPEKVMGKYSIQLRAPRALMKESSIKVEDEQMVEAELDYSAFTAEQKKDFYLGTQLDGVIGGIRNFDNGDGTYNLIGASYFAIESSGIDIIADLWTQKMIEYDPRQSKWYTNARKLKQGEVYWTDPVEDASGRGISMICASPVYVGKRLAGVAGSGGLIDEIRDIVKETKIGDSGYAFLINLDNAEGKMNIITNADDSSDSELNKYREDLQQTDNQEFKETLAKIQKADSDMVELTLNGEKCYMAFSALKTNKWAMVTVISQKDKSLTNPIDEMSNNINKKGASVTQMIASILNQFRIVSIILLVLMIAGIVWASLQFSKRLTAPLATLTDGAKAISDGDLDHAITIKSEDEMEILGNTFNKMTTSLKEYIRNLTEVTAERERIGAELNVATNIQASMLPCIFPPFPDIREIDLYASMNPAKEVGGDFYDFFMADEDHVALVIADVSGKGVPAALFMVIAKTLLKNHAQNGESVEEIFYNTNNQLDEGNGAEMFVTTWIGLYNIRTGVLDFADAGHENPVLIHKDGSIELVKPARKKPPLAAMGGMKYLANRITLQEGDTLFLYTDGVPEATNSSDELYGMERLEKFLTGSGQDDPKHLLEIIHEDVNKFVGDAPQFDDLTMLAMTVRSIDEPEGE